MKRVIFFLASSIGLFMMGCDFEVPTTHDNDASVYGGCFTGEANFLAATVVLQSKCIECHTGYHSSWASLCNESDWTGAGLITAGNTSASSVYTSLELVGGSMPTAGSNIIFTEENRQTLETWILGIASFYADYTEEEDFRSDN